MTNGSNEQLNSRIMHLPIIRHIFSPGHWYFIDVLAHSKKESEKVRFVSLGHFSRDVSH